MLPATSGSHASAAGAAASAKAVARSVLVSLMIEAFESADENAAGANECVRVLCPGLIRGVAERVCVRV